MNCCCGFICVGYPSKTIKEIQMSTINPYQTPTEDLLTDEADSVGDIQFFSPASRIGRLRYFAHCALVTLAFYLLLTVLVMIVASSMGGGSEGFGMALMVMMGLVYIPFIAMFWIIMIQRLHDLDKSGWMSLLMLVPLVNIVVAIYLMCWSGTTGTNRFGKRPPPNKLWHWLVGMLMPLAIIGIVAAVALPAYQDYVTRAKQAQQSEY
jgi:uncharacterized membrane protein YhaH (DUF805 family)